MYYSDQIRRYNFATGLAVGAALGVGLALILRPQQRGRLTGAARVARSLSGGGALDGVRRAVAGRAAAARDLLER